MRSLLFVPGDNERKIAKGLSSAADALILDLEDSVGPDNKPAARRMCAEVLAGTKTDKKLYVRMNALDTPHALKDLAAVVKAKPAGIMLPKCRGAADLHLVAHYLTALEARDEVPAGQTQILPIATETGASMFGLGTYTSTGEMACPRLAALLWGGEDLAAELGSLSNRDAATGQYSPPYLLARSLCLYAASAAGVPAVDAVYVNFRDAAGLEAESLEGARQGFTAKAAIHPDQIEVINRVFTPSAESVAWAQKVLAAFAASPGAGVVNMDGKMVDIPHFKSATRIMARVKAAGG